MHRPLRVWRLVPAGLVASLVLALTVLTAGGVDAVSYAQTSVSPTPTPPSSLQLGSATSPTLGAYLTGPDGHALYTLSSDSQNGSTCTGACLANWPPLLVAPGGTVTGAAGATGTFGTFVRADGTTQVTYDSHPVYYFAHDTAAGQTNGEGIAALGGVWHVALAASVTTPPPSAGASAAAGGSLPPTDTSGTTTGGSPVGILPMLILIVLAGGAAIVAVTARATAARRS